MSPEQIKAVMQLLIQEVRVNNETYEIEIDHILTGVLNNYGLHTDGRDPAALV